jgi:SAM-dependent methyltransferase
MYLLLAVLVIAFSLVARLFYIIHSFRKYEEQVPFVPSPRFAIKKMIEYSGIADINCSSRFYAIDLGSGTGKIVFNLARQTGDNTIIHGVEKSRILHYIAKIRCFFNKNNRRIELQLGSFENVNLSGYTHLFVFLNRPILNSLYTKFKNELSAGSKLYSYMFEMKNHNCFVVNKIALGGKEVLWEYIKKNNDSCTGD